ncbi:MAG: hypothetical protein WBI74_08045 [Caldicoprobacterales bacterium]
MKTIVMGAFRTAILAILVAILTINLVGIYLGFILNQTILQDTFLINILREQETYAQIRQLMFRMVNRSLPNGQDSLPYLEKAVSEEWLEVELNILLTGFYNFASGKRSDTPTISVQKLKKEVVNVLEDNRTYQERARLVQFWFDPLPDEVNMEDFMSVDFLWGIRKVFIILKWLPWVLCATNIIILIFIYIAVLDWKQLILWVSVGVISAGALLILLGIAIVWMSGQMSLVMNIIERVASYEIPKSTVDNFIDTLIGGIVRSFNITGITSIIIGGMALYLVPIKEKNLTLAK